MDVEDFRVLVEQGGAEVGVGRGEGGRLHYTTTASYAQAGRNERGKG